MDPIIVFVILVLIFGFWMLYANEVTFKQRIMIFRGIKNQFDCDKDFSGFMKRMDALNFVSYDNHMFHVVTFRDPMKLYNFENQNV